jgi:hypothetical protein
MSEFEKRSTGPDKAIVLGTGRSCHLQSVRVPLLRHYFVLTFPSERVEPTESEEGEMMAIALVEARRLAKELQQNADAFVLIHSGRGNRRANGWHIHIVFVSGRWQKAWLYFVLWGKNVLQAIGLRRDRG